MAKRKSKRPTAATVRVEAVTGHAEPCCAECGGTEVGMVKRAGRWVCDPCDAWLDEIADLDLDEWEEKRRARLAEQAEY